MVSAVSKALGTSVSPRASMTVLALTVPGSKFVALLTVLILMDPSGGATAIDKMDPFRWVGVGKALVGGLRVKPEG